MSIGNCVAITILVGIVAYLIGRNRCLNAEFNRQVDDVLNSVLVMNKTVDGFTRALIKRNREVKECADGK
jgi:hypothetical protein